MWILCFAITFWTNSQPFSSNAYASANLESIFDEMWLVKCVDVIHLSIYENGMASVQKSVHFPRMQLTRSGMELFGDASRPKTGLSHFKRPVLT